MQNNQQFELFLDKFASFTFFLFQTSNFQHQFQGELKTKKLSLSHFYHSELISTHKFYQLFILKPFRNSFQLFFIKQNQNLMITLEILSENVIKFIENVFIPILPSSSTSQSNALQLWDNFKLVLLDIKNKQASVMDDFMDSVLASKDKCLNSMRDLQNRPRKYISTITKKPSISYQGKAQSTFVKAYDDVQSMKNIPTSSFQSPKRYGQMTDSISRYSNRKQEQQKNDNSFTRIIASFTNIYNSFSSNHQQLTKISTSRS